MLCALVSCGEKQNKDGTPDFLNMDLSRYITLGDCGSLVFELEIKPVTDEAVEDAFLDFQTSLHSYEDYIEAPVSRAAMENDYLQISYVGRVDGEVVDKSPDSPQYLLLADGNGHYDWFNSALFGVYPGETVTAEGQLADAENYGEYAGKRIVYEIKPVAIMGHYTFVEMTDEEYAERVEGLAAGQGMTVEELEAEYGEDDIRDSMRYDEAILFVAQAVNVTYT